MKNGQERGSLSIANVQISEGLKRNVLASGSADFSSEEGIAVNIVSLDDARKLEVVFDAQEGVENFLRLLDLAGVQSNLKVTI